MLTDLKWLEYGQPFPPREKETEERLLRYRNNRDLFNGEHMDVFEESFKRIRRVIGNLDEVISYETILNYHKLISVKTSDLLYGEPPIIKNEEYQEELDETIEHTSMIRKLYENGIDVSRFGDGIFYVFQSDKKGDFVPVSPEIWFPIVSPYNHKTVINHVLCHKVSKESILVEVHYKGYFERKTVELLDGEQGTIIGKTLSEEVVETGLDDFAILHTTNLTTTDRLFGYDDYMDLDSILSELMVRISQISTVLDKHASPSVQGPLSALEKDPVTGKWSLKMGNYFAKENKEDPDVGYVTWDGQLEASFKQIEVLINQLYVISEMGQILLGGQDKGGTEVSGRALRMKMIAPLTKVKRLTLFMTPVIKKLVKSLLKLNGVSDASVSITWQDGLPNDALEEAEIIAKRSGEKASMSVKRALMQYDNMTAEQADAEIEILKAEQPSIQGGNFNAQG